MEKRQLPDGPNARQRIYLIGRLRKAVKWATLFSQLCAIKGDSKTSLEAEVGSLIMVFMLLFISIGPLWQWKRKLVPLDTFFANEKIFQSFFFHVVLSNFVKIYYHYIICLLLNRVYWPLGYFLSIFV